MGTRQGKCEEHWTERQKTYDRRRGSASSRGYGSTWRRLRLMVLHRQPLCADPFSIHFPSVVPATEVDHVVPRKRGGGDDLANLQALCKSCHSRKTAVEDGRWGEAGRAGRIFQR